MAPEELWKEVKGYEGLYLISNLGKIVSLPRVVQSRNKFKNIIVHRKSKSLKTGWSKTAGGFEWAYMN